MLTNDDRDTVRTAVVLPMIIIMIEKNLDELQHSTQTFKPLFIKTSQLLRDKVNADLRDARRELNKRGIKVIEEEVDTRTAKRWKIIQRGSDETMEILRPTIRTDIADRIRVYNEGMFNVMPAPVKGDIMSGVTRDGSV